MPTFGMKCNPSDEVLGLHASPYGWRMRDASVLHQHKSAGGHEFCDNKEICVLNWKNKQFRGV